MDYTITDFPTLIELAAAIAALSAIVTLAKISKPFRVWLSNRSSWIGELFSCSYCFSHWVALVVVLWYKPRIMASSVAFIDYFVTWLCLISFAAIITLFIKIAFFSVNGDDNGS